MKKISHFFAHLRKYITHELYVFFEFLFYYLKKKIITFSVIFEKNKNRLVKVFLMKRGRYNRPFLHLTTISILGFGVLLAPVLSDTYPIFAQKATGLDLVAAPKEKQSVLAGEDVFQTDVSKKPRDKIITYTVEKGDTVSIIAKKFSTKDNQISENTIRWVNDITGDNLTVGDEIKILPTTGIAHKVEPGDTVYSIAKKYNTNPQKIVDWPFNEFANAETFSLVSGQMLVVPDGIKPSEQQYVKPQQVYIAQGPIPVSTGGFTVPVRGGISQFFTGAYGHNGLDITSPIGTPVVASHNGTVTEVHVGTYDGGYGTNVYVSNGAGIVSHYAHMSGVNVSVGQQVVGGRTVVGWIGMTGRTTGPHVHFEIIQNGARVNPLGYVQ